MNSTLPKKSIPPSLLFWLLLIFQLFAWTITPTLLRFNLPMDSLEGAMWGQHLAWGYDKNPFLNAWLTRLAVSIGGSSGWLIYGFSQVCVIVGLWATWRLARKMMPEQPAIIAALLLNLTSAYNFGVIDFNDNVLELALWPLLSLTFYQAVTKQQRSAWLATAIVAGLAMMAKYYAVMLLIPLLLFLIINPQARKSFRNPHFYLAIVLFILFIAPHFIWLFGHHFITIRYALQRVHSATDDLINHIIYPLQFIYPWLLVWLAPLLGVIILTITGKKSSTKHATNLIQIQRFDWQYLLIIGLGPMLGTMLLSLAFGIALQSGWGRPLFFLWGILLLGLFKPQISNRKFHYFLITVFCITLLGILVNVIIYLHPCNDASANYPGRLIAKQLTQEWQQRYHTPLTYVAGPRWTANNIAFYSSPRPIVYMEWNPETSFWMNEQQLKQQGALFVWDKKTNYQLPAEILTRFPQLQDIHLEHFYYMRDKTQQCRVLTIGVAFLPPNSDK